MEKAWITLFWTDYKGFEHKVYFDNPYTAYIVWYGLETQLKATVKKGEHRVVRIWDNRLDVEIQDGSELCQSKMYCAKYDAKGNMLPYPKEN